MSGAERIVIEGELHLTLEMVAECYHVDVTWLREVHAHGALGGLRRHRDQVVVSALLLDRIAEIVRLHEVYRVDPDTIVLLVGTEA